MRRCVTLVLLALCVSGAFAAECHGSPSPNAQPNNNPIDKSTPVFVAQVANGKLYTLGQGDDQISIVHVWGSAYERGFAQGTLQKTQMQKMMNATWNYFVEQVVGAINGTGHSLNFPQWFIDEVSTIGLEAALDFTLDLTNPFTGQYFNDEIEGMCTAAQVDCQTVKRIHMIGELTKGSCSMFGAWGNATRNSLNGNLLQLRALDWASDGPFRNFPQLTVYHSNGTKESGYSFINVGWTGWIGSITGVSEQLVGISEIGVAFPDASFGNESRMGVPFTYLLRDVLQFDGSLADAETHMKNANRTCDLILGVGDGKMATDGFRGVQYSYSVANFINDNDLIPVATWHPPITNVVYFGMDWLCPAYNQILAQQLNKYYGSISPEVSIQYVTSIVQTGDLLVALYDYGEKQLYVANARADNETGPDNAYDRQFLQVDMTSLFSEPAPSMLV